MTGITVVHALPDLRRSAGGIAAMLPELLEALAHIGVHSHVLCCFGDPDDALHGITRKVDPGLMLAGSSRSAMASILDGIGPTDRVLIHSHGLWHRLNHAAVRQAVSVKLPVVISPHGMLMPWARRNKKWRKSLAWHAYQANDLGSAAVIHATSAEEADVVAATALARSIQVIPFGVKIRDQSRQPLPQEKDRVRSLLFLGRLHPIKNLLGLIEGFARADVPNCELLIVGPDEVGHRQDLVTRAEALGLYNRVHFHAPVYGDGKRNLFAQADALVLPSFSENYGAVVAEALSFGLPVLASTGTPWSSLKSERCGWWVSPDPDALAGAIRLFAATEWEDLHRMGERGRAFAERELSWSANAEAMKSMYQSCFRDDVESHE